MRYVLILAWVAAMSFVPSAASKVKEIKGKEEAAIDEALACHYAYAERYFSSSESASDIADASLSACSPKRTAYEGEIRRAVAKYSLPLEKSEQLVREQVEDFRQRCRDFTVDMVIRLRARETDGR